MKNTFCIILFFYPFLTFGSGKFQLEDFAIQMEQITSHPSHIWVSSGYTTVNPTHNTVMGVNGFFSPPFAAGNCNLKIKIQVDTNIITDIAFDGHGGDGLLYAGGTWFPHKIVRYGTYHRIKDGKLISLHVTSELIPLFGQAGYIEKITIRNRASTPVALTLFPELNPGNPCMIDLSQWSWSPPWSHAHHVMPVDDDRWANESVSVGLYRDNETATLPPGKSMVASFTVIVNQKDGTLPNRVDAAILETETALAWQKRIEVYTKNIPSLDSDIDGLADYYLRSVLTGLVCIWENPTYQLNPFFAESGMDGGAICTYHWGVAYTPKMLALMLDDKIVAIVKQMADTDLEKYYAISLDGTGVGVKYSYSPWSFTSIVSTIFKFFGPDKELFEYNKMFILNDEKRKSVNNLIDYGTHSNLLEMRSAGWEHYVVSPNAERSWSLQQLAEMGKWIGATENETSDWKRQAGEIITAVRKELWDDERQWFASVYPDGFRDFVYSIQAYAAMRAGACTPAMEKVLVSKLKDREFLCEYGVSTISKSDSIHFDVIDPDWSGGGSYTGNGPVLALTMYEKGYPEVAWDVLKRHFWMAKHCIYYPQTHFSDRPMSNTFERANVGAGLAGAEAVLFGLIGFQPQFSGELYINPQLVVNGTIEMKGFVYRQNSFDVNLTPKKMTVRRNGKIVYNGAPKRVKIL